MRIGRRALLLGGTGLIMAQRAAALPVPPGDALGFRVIRHGSEIGLHKLTFERQGEALNVRIVIDVVVTFLSVPIARYTFRGTETWRGTTLMALTGRSEKNSEHAWMNAQRGAEGLVVTGSKAKRYVAPPDAMGISYWNKHLLDVPMISMEDGELALPKITPLGPRQTRLASGAVITTNSYNVKESFDVDVSYDPTDTWAGLELTAVDGSAIRYERL